MHDDKTKRSTATSAPARGAVAGILNIDNNKEKQGNDRDFEQVRTIIRTAPYVQ